MKAVMCEAYGPVADLKLKDVPAPVAGEGQVLIDVKAAGCNAPDALLIEGKYQIKLTPPFSPGGEGAGVISAVGGKLKPLVSETFALEDYADAFQCIAERRAKGKVILEL